MSGLDHLLPFIDNGGRRSYIDRRRNYRIVARIPDRRTYKERRSDYDRRKNENMREIIKSDQTLPKTVEESVEWLISEMPLEEKVRIATAGEWILMDLYFSLSVDIEDKLCLWENKALVESCRSVSKDKDFLEEEASYVIIRELWKSLKKLYK